MSAPPSLQPWSRARRAARGLLFACLPLLVLVVLLELALWAAGLGDPDEQLSLRRGFDDRARYLVPDEERQGGWRTQMFDDEDIELHIPARDSRVRVLLLGGSNTSLFPADELQTLLDASEPDRRYEVLNLGRPGYGSERVLILLRQALDVLKPDVVVVYVGHNEFVEAGFAAELAHEWSQPWTRRVGTLAQRLRTVNVLVSLTRGSPEPEAAVPRPEPFDEREVAFDLSYEQTLVYYDVYRHNLEATCDEAQRRGVGLLLSTVVGNMLCVPVVSHHDPRLTPEEIWECYRLLSRCHELVPARLVDGIIRTSPERPPIRLGWPQWGERLMRGELHPRQTAPQEPLPALRPLAPPLDGGPLWTDPARWQPVTRELLARVAAFHARELSPEERLAVAEAAELAEQAVALSPDYAVAVFELGLYRYLNGEPARAVELLRRAACLDCCPNRGNDITNGIVRDVAAAHPEAVLVDADELFRQRCPDQLVGYEVVMDNCHLHPRARSALMADFVPAIERLVPRGR